MRVTQTTIILDYGISREQACILCHLSSECSGCCVRCSKGGCQGQSCSQQNRENDGQRWDTWMHLVKNYPHIKKYAAKVISPELQRKYGIYKLIHKSNQ